MNEQQTVGQTAQQTTDNSLLEAGVNPWADNNDAAQGQQQQATPPTASPPVDGQSQEGQPPTQHPSLVGLTKEQLSEIVRTATTGVAQQVQQGAQPQQQYTQDDFNRIFNVVQVTPETLAKFGLPATPEAAKAFSELKDAIVRQAVTMSHYLVQQAQEGMTKQFGQEYGVAKQFASEYYENKLKDEFFETHPDLKGYDPLLIQVKDQLLREGQDFKGDKQAAFKAVAERTRAVIKSLPGLNGQQSQQTTTGNQSKPTSGKTRMSTVTTGGQGGAGATSSGSGANTAKTLFG